MKRIILVGLLVCTTMFPGCGNRNRKTFSEFLSEEYPYIAYNNSTYRFDTKNRRIEVPEGYVLNQGDSYAWVETEDGYDLIIHFVKEGE